MKILLAEFLCEKTEVNSRYLKLKTLTMKTCILFEGGMKGMGITFHLSRLVCEIYKLFPCIVVIHDGTEQEKGLLELLKSNKIEDFDYVKNPISHLMETLRLRGYCQFIFHAESYGGCRLIEPLKKKYNIHVLLGMNAYKYASSYRNYVVKYIKYRYSKIVDTWVFFSHQSRSEFCRDANVFDHTFVIPWGVEDFSNIIPAQKYKDVFNEKEFYYTKETKYIFYAAQFYAHKSHKTLIEILKFYLKDGKVKLMLGGNGPEMENIHKLCIQLGIAENVIFMGRVPRNIFITHMKNAFLSLVLSKNETFGHCILEPLQLGIPVISTPTGIALKAIQDFKNGFIIDRSNLEKWKEIVDLIINDKIKLNSEYQELYTWPEVASLYVKLYKYVSSGSFKVKL